MKLAVQRQRMFVDVFQHIFFHRIYVNVSTRLLGLAFVLYRLQNKRIPSLAAEKENANIHKGLCEKIETTVDVIVEQLVVLI